MDAVFAQDFPASDFEVIVVVDGSSDGTLEVLRELRPSCRLTFLCQQNKGQADAKSAGIRLAEGNSALLHSRRGYTSTTGIDPMPVSELRLPISRSGLHPDNLLTHHK